MKDEQAVLRTLQAARVLDTLSDVYDTEGVVLALHGKRPAWGGQSAWELILAGRGAEVEAWAEGLAGGPASQAVGTTDE